IMLNGVVDVPPQNTVSVSFPIAAFLKSTRLLPGMHIDKGEVIAVMEDAALIQMQQDYLVAKSKLNYAMLDFKRQQSLNETKTTSDKVYQQAGTEYETQRVLVMALAEKLRLIGIAPEKLTENTISRRVSIHSPINGFVSKVHVNIGKYVQPSEVLFELINPDDLHAALTVFEKDIASVQAGQKVLVSFVDQPETKIPSTVFLVTRSVDETRAGIIHCHFDKQPPSLKPGMFLNAELTTTEANVTAVPENAIVRYAGKEFVFVKLDSTQFKMTEVTPGRRSEGLVELKQAQNILVGKQIIISNAYTALSKLKNISDE
ncbi:MAG TPA: efflux RND transporter periplasmic adaptor subunit, partial [Flavitalea sp.]|nr:efflux RND transporter periplasmic adaptor subunit [Flavitalea sp.]